jgi:cytochrome c peroxidase
VRPGRAAQVVSIALLAATALITRDVVASSGSDPAAIRRAARAAGLDSLRRVRVLDPDGLDQVLNPGGAARQAAIQLGKALFWDMQVGSDGQACASCHFHAGADSRTKNQLSPDAGSFGHASGTGFSRLGSGGGPNHRLTPSDFPFHRLEDELARTSPLLHDSDDVCSSQSVFHATFGAVVPGRPEEIATPRSDPVFQVSGVNVRRVATRNAPTVVNAVLNRVNFWDGRAHPVFNGVNGRGPLDRDATILVSEGGRLAPRPLRLANASLASQAVEPPRSDREMAFTSRPFRALARKLLHVRPLASQLVHPHDGVLGPLARARIESGRVGGEPGLTVGYADLVARAFRASLWESSETVDGYSLMENNFSLFFGVAIQLYESTLVSDRTPFDQFMEGDDRRLDDEQLEGLLVFLNRGRGRSDDPVFARVRTGNCVSCHGGPALTDAAYGPAAEARPIDLQQVVAHHDDGFAIGQATALRDRGFSNTGVRPTGEDLGRGGTDAGVPLSFARQRLLAVPGAPPLPPCGEQGALPCPAPRRAAVDGAFKIPGLRNVALTGPYFHNGGQATLRQVLVFYQRLGDFSAENVADLDPELTRIYLVEPDKVMLLAFLESLTDERVRDEQAPFDHPELLVPHGQRGDTVALRCTEGGRSCDEVLAVPPVGRQGRRAAGLAPLGTFLDLDPRA